MFIFDIIHPEYFYFFISSPVDMDKILEEIQNQLQQEEEGKIFPHTGNHQQQQQDPSPEKVESYIDEKKVLQVSKFFPHLLDFFFENPSSPTTIFVFTLENQLLFYFS